jgi:hypothetical protein
MKEESSNHQIELPQSDDVQIKERKFDEESKD